jgi:hypothetical protein
VKPTYEAALQNDAAPFDSLSRHRFQRGSARGHRAAAGRITGPAVLVVDGREQRVPAEPRVETRAPRFIARATSRFPVCHRSAQDDLANRCLQRARGVRRRGESAAALGLISRGPAAWTKGWTRWVLEQYGFAFTLIHPEDFKTPLARRSTC